MGIQAMHNYTGFLLNQLWELDSYERFLSRELQGSQFPILHKFFNQSFFNLERV